MAVMKISIPVIILDETLKFIARKFTDGKTNYFELACIVLAWGVYIPLAVKTMWTFFLFYAHQLSHSNIFSINLSKFS